MKTGPKVVTNSRKKVTREPLGPIKWQDIPHHELRDQALSYMDAGSPGRAEADAVRSVLKRRLSRLEHADHTRYIELECGRIVETLRHLRDVYRHYVELKARGAVAEQYWAILRFGLKDWAVMLIRAAAVTYVDSCKLQATTWNALFGFDAPFPMPGDKEEQEVGLLSQSKIEGSITGMLCQASIDQICTGGPFGYEAQASYAQTYPGRAFLLGKESFSKVLKRRLDLWSTSQPWVEGLCRLFDAAQEEMLFQFDQLRADSRYAESNLVTLTPLQRIARRYLSHLGERDNTVVHASPEEQWKKLLGHLDQEGIAMEVELHGVARKTLMALRRKGHKVRTWSDSYDWTKSVLLDDGTQHTLRREITKHLHNEAKKADYQMAKVWSDSKKQKSQPDATRRERTQVQTDL